MQSFVAILSQNLEEPESVTESFEKFSEIFKLSINQSCKLAIPKTTKRNFVNNPWMTAGITQGDKKKTWKIINELRGKQKTNVKASFVIGNEHIICRRIIAEKFNNYFVSLASNLNYET